MSSVDLLFDELVGYISSAQWTSEEPDYTRDYSERFRKRRSGNTMLPTPGIDRYILTAHMHYGTNTSGDPKLTAPEVYQTDYTMRVDYSDATKELLKRLPTEQLTHRSRAVAFGAWRMATNEMHRRAEGRRLKDDVIKDYSPPQRVADEVKSIIYDETLRHLKPDIPSARDYGKDHETSSLGNGIKWGDLLEAEDSQWLRLHSSVREAVERSSDQGKYLTRAYHAGFRARADALSIHEIRAGIARKKMFRTRMILFDPSMSTWTAFIPNKTSWYTSILTKCADVFGVSGEWTTPLIDGGQVYVKAAEWFNEYRHFLARDGANWETSVAYFGKPLRPFWTRFLGYDHLASGVSVTSMVGTLGMLWELAKRVGPSTKGDWKAMVLGDDLNVFSSGRGEPLSSKIAEVQDEDTRMKFILGVSYRWDVSAPRVTGMKWTADNQLRSRAVHLDHSGYGLSEVEGRKDPHEARLWTGLYGGVFGDRTLLEALTDVQAADYKGPTTLLSNLVKEESRRMAGEEGSL